MVTRMASLKKRKGDPKGAEGLKTTKNYDSVLYLLHEYKSNIRFISVLSLRAPGWKALLFLHARCSSSHVCQSPLWASVDPNKAMIRCPKAFLLFVPLPCGGLNDIRT